MKISAFLPQKRQFASLKKRPALPKIGGKSRKLPRFVCARFAPKILTQSAAPLFSDRQVKFLSLMVTTKFYLDTRKVLKGGQGYSLRINITQNRKIASYPLGISLTEKQWNAQTEKVVGHPEAMMYNKFIAARKIEVDTIILKLADEGKLADMSAVQIRDYIQSVINPQDVKPAKPEEDQNTVAKVFERFMAHKKNPRTKEIYRTTYNRIKAYLSEDAFKTLKFEDIDLEWLLDFDEFMAITAPSANARAINMRNLRAVCNFAIDCEITTHYPFRRFKIKQEVTRKRNFDVETLRRIFNHQCAEEWQQKYLDFFKLSFMLIGINCVDLCGLTRINGDRIDYIRAKTHKPYSIKVESEAREIIERYAGEGHLLNFTDTYANYRHFYNNLCIGLREIRDQLSLDELTSYWARHSWATIAASLDIPKDTIAAGLGHGGNTVTDIYIEFDRRKVDEANRKVLDWVLYGVHPNAPKKRGRPKRVQTRATL